MLKSYQRAKTVGQQGNSADALQPLLIFVVKNVTANSTPKNDVIVTANQHHTPAVFRDCAIPSLSRNSRNANSETSDKMKIVSIYGI